MKREEFYKDAYPGLKLTERRLLDLLDFLNKNAYYLSVGFNSLSFRFCPPEDTELALKSKKFQIFFSKNIVASKWFGTASKTSDDFIGGFLLPKSAKCGIILWIINIYGGNLNA